MAPNIFLTVGYIGGTVYAFLTRAHPEYDFTLLVRSEERGEAVKAKYPDAKLVYGSLDDADIIEKAASEADIVIHTADSSDNVPSAKAIARGLAAGHTASNPGYWIHLSGTGILMFHDAATKRYGEAPLADQTFSDVDGTKAVLSIPDEAIHRDVDKIAQAAVSDAVRLAIVSPPCIYGEGSGPVNTRSIQVPDMVAATLKNGFAPIVGSGLTEWDNVHVNDLADLYLRLVEAAQDPAKRADEAGVFGHEGYFFLGPGTHKWSDVARWVAEEAASQGYLPEAKTKVITSDEASELGGPAANSWALNSKGISQRAEKLLGWKGTGQPSLREEVTALISREAKTQGLTPKA
ncbi:Nucleoside-diphosphate-sugar epimerase [Geosmithia morbida]|uniref:Nucleoside-diphosphate-sugar epimerase n=1 Tax=Geosmithia morbida TaxID=1094350 RepID=A0A9P4YY13_9HYPO|nr:Nucleoside-diphosphate-sugar epimerase [Geosmithia morbida]KAF4125181.1 Nucleoside-diphosphate-sugar epimerase [Geosmithia morbida]